MRCPTCSHENPDSNKFCAECGAELIAICPSCGSANPPSSKFCGECGTNLRGGAATPSAPSRAERRLVSVLFADLVGFTPFSESRDSEEVRGLLTTYFDRSREIVERFGGEVDKFIGDAVMAVWGAVEAREDDAERSVRAALELVDMVSALGAEIDVPDLALRAGVTSGETSVGPGGNEKGLVVGDLVNTASRLQSIAEPRSVLAGEPTRALTAAAIAFEELGPQTVKGKEMPVPAFRALRIISERGGARRVEGLEPPFTGRDVELRMLKDQFHATGRDNSARLVSVIGEAGIGKTRLSWELEKYMDGLAEDVYWHRGRSPSYGEGLTMWALGEMVRRRAGISETDDAAKSRLKLRTAVAEYVTSEDDRRWLEPRLAALLALEDAPHGDRDELFAAFRTFFHHISALGTTVLVFEDMHWADPGLLDFVSELVERSPRHPIFVVTLSRPDLLETRPGFGSGHHNSISLHLAPLSDASMADLITGMVQGISDDSVAALVERAGGIPMYAVEYVRMLIAGGELTETEGRLEVTGSLDTLSLPESLQAVVGARLDRLDASDREVVQDAAVLGQSFTADGLAIVRGSDDETVAAELAPLVRQQLFEIDDDPRSPERGQYQFVQSVIREVAYGRLSKADRYAKHLTVAQYFEGLKGTELVGAVASHYIAAHEAAPKGEGDDLLERGRVALWEAAGRASDLGSYEAAISLLDQALQLTDDLAERARMLERGSVAAGWASLIDRSIEMAAEAVRLFEEVGDESGRLRALTAQANSLSTNFRADEAVDLLAPVYERLDDPTTIEEVSLALETARAFMLAQDHDRAIEIGDRVLARAEEILPPSEVIDGIITRGTSLASARPMEALAILSGAISLADQHDLQAQAIRAFNNHYVVLSYDAERIEIDRIEEFLARTRRLGAPVWLNRSLQNAALVYYGSGDLDRANDLLDEMESYQLNEFEQQSVDMARAQFVAVAEGTPEQLAALWDAVSVWDEGTDPQLRRMVSGLKSHVKVLEGDFEAAFDFAVQDRAAGGVLGAVANAVALDEVERLEQARSMADDVLRSGGRLHTLIGLILDAAMAAREGDAQRAANLLSEALPMSERTVDDIFVAIFQSLACKLLGSEHPLGRQAGLSARAWLREHRFAKWEQTLDQFLPDAEPDMASETA